MKRLLIICFVCLTCLSGFAQKNKIIIGTKKVQLKYGDQKDSLLLPVVSANYPALQMALSDTALFAGDKLAYIVENYGQCGCGTTGFSYEVAFLNSSAISIKLFYEGMGAYPSSHEEWTTLDIETGKPFILRDGLTIAGQNLILSR
nr:hypothetical protein [uncultured Mucilaginibacter sp.]